LILGSPARSLGASALQKDRGVSVFITEFLDFWLLGEEKKTEN